MRIRKPSLRKSIAARTKGQLTRKIKRAIIPGYGKKGMGMLRDPERAIKNKIYRNTTIGVGDIMREVGKKTRGKK